MREIPGIPYRFDEPALLARALSHRSTGRDNNERLEFLGDSILNFVVAARLFEIRTGDDEGDLSRLRARVVRGETLARLALELKLGDYIRLGEGELKSGGYRRDSILADALEAVLGAIYLDGGYEPCAAVIRHVCDPVIRQLPDASELKDPKTRLQEWLQGEAQELPEYELVSEAGPAHRKHFVVRCIAPTADIETRGEGKSRQRAEQAAAAAALAEIAARTGK